MALSISAVVQASPVSVFDSIADGTSGLGHLAPLAAATPRQATTGGNHSTQWQRAFALDAATPSGLMVAGDGAAALWNFIARIHAQQRDRHFAHLETDLNLISQLPAPTPVSAVPLPGSAWLLLMGLMGGIGSRMVGKSPAREDRRVIVHTTGGFGTVGDRPRRAAPSAWARWSAWARGHGQGVHGTRGGFQPRLS